MPTDTINLVRQQAIEARENARRLRLQGNPPSTVPSSTSRPSRPTSTRSRRVNELMSRQPRIDTVAMVRDQARNAYIENRANRLNNLANNMINNIRRQNLSSNAITRARANGRTQYRLYLNSIEENISRIFNNNQDLITTLNTISTLIIPTQETIYNDIYKSMEDFTKYLIYNFPNNINNLPELTSMNTYNIVRTKIIEHHENIKYLENGIESLELIYQNTSKSKAHRKAYTQIVSIKENKLSFFNNTIDNINFLLSVDTIVPSFRNTLNELKTTIEQKKIVLNQLTSNKIRQMISLKDNYIKRLNNLSKLLIKYTKKLLIFYMLPITRLVQDRTLSGVPPDRRINIILNSSNLKTLMNNIVFYNNIIHINEELLNDPSYTDYIRNINITIETHNRTLNENITQINDLMSLEKQGNFSDNHIKYSYIDMVNRFLPQNQLLPQIPVPRTLQSQVNQSQRELIRLREERRQQNLRHLERERPQQSLLNPFRTTSTITLRSECETVGNQISRCVNNIRINNPKFESFKQILINKCSIFNKEQNLTRENNKQSLIYKFKNYFRIPEYINIPSIDHYQGNSIASLFARYINTKVTINSNVFNSIFFNDDDRYFVKNKFLILDDNGDVTGEDNTLGIDVGGVRRNFFSGLLSELFTDKIFIKREGSNKYFINPEYEPNKQFKYILSIVEPDFNWYLIGNKILFYTFIGNLLSLIFISDLGFENYFSSSIMAHFIYNNEMLDDDDYVYFLYEDFPELFNSFIGMMNVLPEVINPQQPTVYNDPIRDSYLSFNDQYELKPDDEDLNKDNFVEFIKLTAKYMMTKNILRKDIDIKRKSGESQSQFNTRYNKSCSNYENYLRYLISGIPYDIKEYVANKKLTLRNVTSFLTIGSMTAEKIENFKTKFRNYMNHIIYHIDNPNPTIKQDLINKTTQLTNFFIDFVLTKDSNETQEDFNIFISKLLSFWSGVSFYTENKNYIISYISDLDINRLPESHTCFYRIDLPGYTTGEMLKEKIRTAVMGIEEGIGLRGGKKIKNVKKV